MAAIEPNLVEQYLLTIRICSPGRVQDFRRQFFEMWKHEPSPAIEAALNEAHRILLQENRLVQVRKGTYILGKESFDLTALIMKERVIDNARLFLMKKQRREYHKSARRFGLVAASADQPKLKTS